MRLLELLNGTRVIGGERNLIKNVEGIFSDSRNAIKNGAFVAIKGEKRDGNNYIDKVIDQGAIAVITNDYKTFKKYECAVLVENAREALSYMWRNYYNNPTKNMKVVAITGTNGKTSCAYHLYSILKNAGKSRALISTIETLINDKRLDLGGGSEVLDISAAMTTPDPEKLFYAFNQMKEAGVEYVVMEASSHALEQEKLSSIHIDYAIFTNLSEEHLDFHKNMENYFMAKQRLFLKDTIGIINIDDKYGKRIKIPNGEGVSCSKNKKSNFYVENLSFLENGYEYFLCFKDKRVKIKGRLQGEHSVYNSLLSASCAISMGIDEKSVIQGIYSLCTVPGRLEKIEGHRIYIDYAHTPMAMEKILLQLKSKSSCGRLIALFGCGGDRDKSKRPKMAKIASEYADLCIITNDNSRTESPIAIIRDILEGMSDECDYVVIPNREKAIFYGISRMKSEDTLVLFGKGHEKYEIDKNGMHYFDEREIIRRALDNDKDKKI